MTSPVAELATNPNRRERGSGFPESNCSRPPQRGHGRCDTQREGGRRGRREHRLGRPLANRDRRAVEAQRQRSGCRPDLAGSKRRPCSRQGALLRLQGRQHRLAAHGALDGVLSQLGRRLCDGRVGAVSLRLRIRPVEQEDIGGLIAALAPGVGEAQMRMRFEESLAGIGRFSWPNWTDAPWGPSVWAVTAFRDRARYGCSHSMLERPSGARESGRLW